MNDIEHDEELQLVFASSPNRFVRNGNFIIFGILTLLLVLSGFIRYPETVNGNVSLYISPSSANLVSKTSGRVNLLIPDGKDVKQKAILGYIESSATLKDVIYFSDFIDSLAGQLASKKGVNVPPLQKTLNLGEIQPYYVALLNTLNSSSQYNKYNNFQSEKDDIEDQILSNKLLRLKQMENLKIASNELKLMDKKFKRDSLLFEKKVISLAEFENSRLSYLPYQRAYETLNQNILSTNGVVNSLIYKTKSLNNANGQSLAEFSGNLKSSILSAKSETDKWKDKYLLISPIEGKMSLINNWNSFQNVAAGAEIMSIIPNKQGVIAKAVILPSGSGKMKFDDVALISLDDFSQEEFGTLKAKVKKLPSMQSEGQYIVILNLPEGLKTNFNKKIPLREGMTGSIRIITKNTTLLNRMFFQLKKALNNA